MNFQLTYATDTTMNNREEDSTLLALFNQACKKGDKESGEALLAHWKTLCELLDNVKLEDV